MTHVQVVGEWLRGAFAACPQAVGGGVLHLQRLQHIGVALHRGHGGVWRDPAQGDPGGRQNADTVDLQYFS